MAYKALENRILNYCKQERLFRWGDRVIVGVSGGADSVCLLHVLNVLKSSLKIKLMVVHVNHGLREAAVLDAEYVKKICQDWDIPYYEYVYDVAKIAEEKKMSLEEAGRSVRYSSYEQARVEHKGTKVALAHHMDDQVETILWNLFRGSGAKGLSGMSSRRGEIVRPLLCVSRDEIENYLKEEGIEFRIDETNALNEFTRNKLRNKLIPTIEEEYNKQSKQHIAGAGSIIAQMEDYISKQGMKAYKRCTKSLSSSSILIKTKLYEKEEPILKEFILRQALCDMAGTAKDIGQVHIQMLSELTNNQVSREIDLPYNLNAVRTYEGVCIRKKKKEETKETGVHKKPEDEGLVTFVELTKPDEWKKYTKEKRYTKYFDYDIIKDSLSIRTRQTGDYLVIDNEGNTQKLKYYFINEKIPREIRDEIPLLVQENKVIWVIGYRISEDCKVTEKTQKVMAMTYKNKDIIKKLQ